MNGDRKKAALGVPLIDLVAIIHALEAYEAAREGLFIHCLSNGVFNAAGEPLDCTALNEAHLAAEKALAKFGPAP